MLLLLLHIGRKQPAILLKGVAFMAAKRAFLDVLFDLYSVVKVLLAHGSE